VGNIGLHIYRLTTAYISYNHAQMPALLCGLPSLKLSNMENFGRTAHNMELTWYQCEMPRIKSANIHFRLEKFTTTLCCTDLLLPENWCNDLPRDGSSCNYVDEFTQKNPVQRKSIRSEQIRLLPSSQLHACLKSSPFSCFLSANSTVHNKYSPKQHCNNLTANRKVSSDVRLSLHHFCIRLN
jgi:hypothetical protein